MVFPHTTPEGRLVNLYGRAVGTAAQVPKAKRHDHLPGEKGYFNAAALQAGAGPLWVCEGAFDALALLAAGVPRVVAIFGVQGWRWEWAREVRELVFALDADAAGPPPGRALARQAARRWTGQAGRGIVGPTQAARGERRGEMVGVLDGTLDCQRSGVDRARDTPLPPAAHEATRDVVGQRSARPTSHGRAEATQLMTAAL